MRPVRSMLMLMMAWDADSRRDATNRSRPRGRLLLTLSMSFPPDRSGPTAGLLLLIGPSFLGDGLPGNRIPVVMYDTLPVDGIQSVKLSHLGPNALGASPAFVVV